MPLFAFLVMTTYLNMENIKKIVIFCIKKVTKDDGGDAQQNETIEMHHDDVVIVDHNQSTTTM